MKKAMNLVLHPKTLFFYSAPVFHFKILRLFLQLDSFKASRKGRP